MMCTELMLHFIDKEAETQKREMVCLEKKEKEQDNQLNLNFRKTTANFLV